MRLIDADALKEKMRRTSRYLYVKYDIDEAPTIDAEPVMHGHWTEHILLREMGTLNGLKCSICGYEKAGRNVKYNYCPNCGAMMDEVKE